jgi:glutaredoxin
MENIEYEYPNDECYTIYSKSGCPSCVGAKRLLQCENPAIVDCDEYLIENKPAFLEYIRLLIGREYKTFPMIFHKGKFVGGFTELKPYYAAEKNAFPDPFSTTKNN